MNKYLQLFKIGAVQSLKNYKELIGLSIFLITCLTIFSHIWKIATVKSGAVNLDPNHLLWFIALNEWVIIALPEIQYEIEQDLRSGRLAYLLVRPISYPISVFSEACGSLIVNLVFLGIVAFSFVWIQVGGLSFDAVNFAITIILGIFAGILGLIFQMLIGISAFWMQEVGPLHWLWEKLLFMLGGLILPLTVYPQWIQSIAHATPFPAILGGRSALVFDPCFSHTCWIISSLIFWIIVGSSILFFLYRRGLRILNIQGG